ncbi:MAG TPA: CPBP family glutamic-type intramembrane protease [Chloroflexota bacterium]|nr:CPBP family glutamic-type intramembrane protease [Chloroflexota bacterium]
MITTCGAFLQRHPVLSFYILVFTISWGGILLVIGGPGAIPGTPERVERLFFPALLALFCGPSLASILMTALVDGRAGLRELLGRLLQWRVNVRSYVIALLPAPALVLAVFLALSRFSPVFTPLLLTADNRASLLLFGIAWGLIGGGLLEELGETGFAVTRLRRQHSALRTALIVGLLWGAWHFLIAIWAGGSLAGGQWTSYLLGLLFFYEGVLPAYRVLMVWLYDRAGSLLIAMLMHASLSASTLIVQPSLTGVPYVMGNVALAAALWVVVGTVAVAHRRDVRPRSPAVRGAPA